VIEDVANRQPAAIFFDAARVGSHAANPVHASVQPRVVDLAFLDTPADQPAPWMDTRRSSTASSLSGAQKRLIASARSVLLHHDPLPRPPRRLN